MILGLQCCGSVALVKMVIITDEWKAKGTIPAFTWIELQIWFIHSYIISLTSQ
jgi:hypothetical protein